MRARLIVDAANFWAKRGNSARADGLYRFALQLYPDKASRLIVEIDRGTNLVRVGELETAKETLQAALQAGQLGVLGLKYETACRYNLAVACRKLGQEAEALRQFNQVLDLMLGSPYGQAVQAVLEKKKPKQSEGDASH